MAALTVAEMQKRPTIAYVTGKVQAYLASGGLDATAWAVGDVIAQVFRACVFTIWTFTGMITAAIRGAYLDTATDPSDVGGDPDGPKWLSLLGEGTYGTVREGQTFATTLLTFVNASVSQTYAIHVGDTAQNSNAMSPAYKKTYRVEDDGIHFVAGVYQLAPGVTVHLPIIADEIGTGSNAAAGDIATLVNVLLGVSVTNASAAVGTDIEDADVYRERCREAQIAVSPNGPRDGYLYLARTARDGTPLLRIADGAPVSITRVYVSPSSASGIVLVYYADADGAADASSGGDVETANANILSFYDPLTDTFYGASATNTVINVTYTFKINSKKNPGLTKAEGEQATKDALAAYFPTTLIGGDDQVLGAGVVYTVDLGGIIQGAAVGIYDVVITTPATSTTAIALGHVPAAGTFNATGTVV